MALVDTKNPGKWARTRQMGRTRFVLYYGVLAWGLLTGFLFGVFMSLYDGLAVSQADITRMMIGLVVFPVFGILFGILTWRTGEKRWRQHNSTAAGAGRN